MFPYQIWNRLFTEENIKQVYIDKLQTSHSIGLDRISNEKFLKNIDENIQIILKKVNNRTYKFTRYKRLLISKGENKYPRVISIPTNRDKLVLTMLNKFFDEVYQNDCKSPLPQVIVNKIIINLESYKYYIKIDIKNFYSNIDHKILLEKLKRKFRKKEIIDLIEKAIRTETIDEYNSGNKKLYKKNKKGIPEGLPISNSLANIYFKDFDKKYSSRIDILYCRYVDDILILCNTNPSVIYEEVKKDIESLYLTVNDEKKDKGSLDKEFVYLGYLISKDKISVRKTSVMKIENTIERLIQKVNSSNIEYIVWKLNLKISGFIMENNKYGWLFFYSQINDITLLFHLDFVVKNILSRYHLEEKIKPKKFVKTYFEITKALHDTRYILNIDNLSLENKKEILQKIYTKNIEDLSDVSIEIMFKRIMKKEIIDIEKDIQHFS